MTNEPTSKEVEYILAYLYQGSVSLEKNVEQQHLDIDLRDTNGRGYSVKYQKKAAQTGNFSFETKQINTITGEEVPGNFMKCTAFGYFMALPAEEPNLYRVYWFRTEELHAFVLGKKRRTVRNSPAVRASNRGRKFDDAESVLVPVSEVARIACNTTTFDYAQLRSDLKYHLFLKKNGFHDRPASTYRSCRQEQSA